MIMRDLPKFTGYAVLYTDQGPTGIGGQSTDLTMPHAYLLLCPDEEAALQAAQTLGRAGKRREVRVLFPDSRSGVWALPGVELAPVATPAPVASIVKQP